MARATRSSTQQQSQTQNASAKAGSNPATALKGSKRAHTSKKRKRPSATSADIDPELADTDDDDAQDRPAAKHPRPEPTFQGAADTPLQPQDAVQILTVLESIDSQGLLDRAFPPPANDGPSSSRTTLSLRQLLLDAQNHPLRALRDAVQPLLPLTSHARSHDSRAAQEQKRFCSLALALLEQASRHTLDLSRTSAFEDGEHPVSLPPVKHRYALMQKLPNGEWWTSPLSSDDPRARLSAREAKALKHGEAELVSILPSAVDPFEDVDVPPLGGYAPGPKKDKRGKAKQPQGINIPNVRTGTFLDYGPWASFAPSFDSDAAEVGRDALGALYDARARRRIARQMQAQELLQTPGATVSADDDAMQVDEEHATSSRAIDPALSAAAAPSPPPATDDVIMLASDIMADLELERSVSELLQRNARAIADLEVMQLQRLSQGGASVEEGSEEWLTANQILDTLTLLASLRPRIPDSDQSPLVPSPQVLHALQRTLPLEASAGFKGTLADGRQSALRDNNTVRVKVAGTAAAAATNTTAKAAASTSAAPSPATPAQRFPPGVPYPFPPPTHPYYPNANYQSPAPTGTPAAPTPGQPFAAYPGYYPGYYPYPFAAPPRDKAMEAAQKFYAYGAQGASGNAAKAGTPGQNGWPTYPGMPVTLPPHLRRYPAQPFPGTPTPAGR